MSARSSKGITHLKSAHGKPGSGVVAMHPDGLVTSAGKLDDGRWFCMAVTAAHRGAFAIGSTHTEAVAQVCDDLGLSKARIIGGRYAQKGFGVLTGRLSRGQACGADCRHSMPRVRSHEPH